MRPLLAAVRGVVRARRCRHELDVAVAKTWRRYGRLAQTRPSSFRGRYFPSTPLPGAFPPVSSVLVSIGVVSPPRPSGRHGHHHTILQKWAQWDQRAHPPEVITTPRQSIADHRRRCPICRRISLFCFFLILVSLSVSLDFLVLHTVAHANASTSF